MSRCLTLACLAALLLPVAGCRHPDKVRILETQKALVLDTTLPKQDFWDQVGRKGEALRKERSAAAELASVQQQIAATRSSLAQARAQLEAARKTNAQAAQVLSGQLHRVEQAQQQVAADQGELTGFQARQRSRGGA